MHAVARLFALLLCGVVLVGITSGCSRNRAQQPAPDAESERLDLPGGAASLFGARSDRGVLILADEEVGGWRPLAAEMARIGYVVLVVPHSAAIEPGSVATAATALTRRGVERIVIVGSGRAASVALAAASNSTGVAVLNPPGELDAAQAGGVAPVAFLAMASLSDPASSTLARQLYSAAQEPRTLALYPARDPAPAAFAGASNELKTAFLDFLRTAFEPLSAGSARLSDGA